MKHDNRHIFDKMLIGSTCCLLLVGLDDGRVDNMLMKVLFSILWSELGRGSSGV